MHHVGKKEFYEDAKHKIDSLIQDGYIIYYENVNMPAGIDSLVKDTLYRKSRKITGVDLSTMKANQGYIDTVNGTFMGLKAGFITKYKLVNQGKGMLPLKDSLHVKNVDANFPQLIVACEKKFGPVELTSYDYDTKFGENYKSKKNEDLFNYFIVSFRNKLITDSILNSSQKKIAMIYGSLHFDGILENLTAADKNYKQVNSF